MNIRNCPNCNSEMTYTTLAGYRYGIKNNTVCKSCSTKNQHRDKGHIVNGIYEKNCPGCGNLQTYKYKQSYFNSIHNNSICRDCVSKNRVVDRICKKIDINCKICNNIKTYNLKNLTIKEIDNTVQRVSDTMCRSCASKIAGHSRKDWHPTEEQLIKWSECKTGEKSYWYGKTLSDEHAKNISDALTGRKMNKQFRVKQHIIGKQRSVGGQQLNYNKLACKYFDWLNMYMGWNGQHALNGGEIRVGRYFVDYYEPELNLVIEWDEEHHFTSNGLLQDNDIFRQDEITKALKCDFYRIREKDFINGR